MSSSSLSPSTSRTDDTLSRELMADKLDLFRERQRLTDTYLGNTNIADRVTWIDSNRGHRLVSKEVVESNAPEDTKDNTSTEAEIPSAELSVIVRISRRDCWLAPDGFWKGPTSITPTLADLKLSCAGEAPGYPEFDIEFEKALGNLRQIVDLKRTQDVETMKGLFLASALQGDQKIKFRHPVFTRRIRRRRDDGTESPDSEGLPSEFQIDNWPAESEAAQQSLQKMSNTHITMPLPAYDVEGNLITPDEYRTKIPGGLAVVHFTLAHWFFAERNKSEASDTYVVDIASITMLETPIPMQSGNSPGKKRPALTDPHRPVPSSPSKKQKQKKK